MKMKLRKRLLLSGLSATLIASPGLAQQNDGNQRQSQRESNRSSQQRDRQSDDWQNEDSRGRNQSQSQDRRGSQQDPRYRVSPTGWVRIAADYDNDGTFDAIETLYVYDLERARESSRQRADQEARNMRGSNNMRGQQGQSQRSNGMRTYEQKRETVKGEIKNLKMQSMTGSDSKGVMARIETEQGRTANVCLGPENQLQKLDLNEGDSITVEGVRGRVNDRTVLLARKVSSGDQQVDVQMPDSRRMKRVRGEIVSKRDAKFRNQDEQHVVAKVRLKSGKQETVNLGPKSKVDKLELSQGDDVSMLVRPGRVNGQSALIAEQLNSGDQTVEVSIDRRFTSRNAQQNRQQTAQRDGRSENRNQREMQSDSQTQNRGQTQDRGQGQNWAQGQNRGQGQNWEQGQNQDSQNQDSRNTGQAALGIAVSDGEEGVTVEAIFPNSPAEKSELREGDEIVSINGESIDSARQVIQTIQQRSPNEQLEIKANRNGETQTIRVRLADRSQLARSRN